MQDPKSEVTYAKIYQELLKSVKHGTDFCKEVTAVFQIRADLELNYGRTLKKLVTRLCKVSSKIEKGSVLNALLAVYQEMTSTSELHINLAKAFQEDFVKTLQLEIDEECKRKKQLEQTADKATKIMTENRSNQLKLQRKLYQCSRNHEMLLVTSSAGFSIRNDKDSRKVEARMQKSMSALEKADQEYYEHNILGAQYRCQWERTMEQNCEELKELQNQRLLSLQELLNKYSILLTDHTSSITNITGKVQESVGRISVYQDLQPLLEGMTNWAHHENTELMLADYYEEVARSHMDEGRLADSLNNKISRLNTELQKTKNENNALRRLTGTYGETSSFAHTRAQLESKLGEGQFKVHLLELNQHKLECVLADLETHERPRHMLSDRVIAWSDKQGLKHAMIRMPKLKLDEGCTLSIPEAETEEGCGLPNCPLGSRHSTHEPHAARTTGPPGVVRQIRPTSLPHRQNNNNNTRGKWRRIASMRNSLMLRNGEPAGSAQRPNHRINEGSPAARHLGARSGAAARRVPARIPRAPHPRGSVIGWFNSREGHETQERVDGTENSGSSFAETDVGGELRAIPGSLQSDIHAVLEETDGSSIVTVEGLGMQGAESRDEQQATFGFTNTTDGVNSEQFATGTGAHADLSYRVEDSQASLLTNTIGAAASDLSIDTYQGEPLPVIGKCRVLYDHIAITDEELTVREGEILNIHRKDPDGWWFGEVNGQEGLFPALYVQEIPLVD
ncbi:nostrin [Lampetra planeri]